MTPEERATMIAYRMAQAQDTLDQADILAQAGKWPGVVNRAYYAMFYAGLGLLLHRGVEARKHTGVLSLIDREYVRTGVLPKEQSVHLRAAFFARQNADYTETIPVEAEKAKALLHDAGGFLAAVRGILQPPST